MRFSKIPPKKGGAPEELLSREFAVVELNHTVSEEYSVLSGVCMSTMAITHTRTDTACRHPQLYMTTASFTPAFQPPRIYNTGSADLHNKAFQVK